MNEVAAKTPAKWMELGTQLGLETALITAFDDQHRGKSTRIFIEIFNYWKNHPLAGDKPKIWSTVIEALKTPLVDEATLASQLESRSITPNSCNSTNSMESADWQQSSE